MNEHHGKRTGDDELAWADLGSCVGVDPDVFFPERGDESSRARALCRACPVRSECLAYAIESGQRFGIWGGMTPSQRRRRRRRPVLTLAGAPESDRTVEGGRPVRHLRLVGQAPVVMRQ